jgi:hypothetical protein
MAARGRMATIVSNDETNIYVNPPKEYSSKYRKDPIMKGKSLIIDPNNPPKWLKQLDTGRIYNYTPLLGQRADMAPCDGPRGEQPAPVIPVIYTREVAEKVSEPTIQIIEEKPVEVIEPVAAEVDRMTAIKAAIAQIPPERYTQAAGGRPRLPRVGEVSKLTGFQVGVKEIISAMQE